MPASRVLLWICAMGLALPTASQGQETSPNQPDLRLWTRATVSESTGRAFLTVKRLPAVGAQADAGPLVFSGEVLTPQEMGPLDLRFTLEREGQTLPVTQTLRVSSEEGAAPFRFSVDAAQLQHGEYTVSMEVDRLLSGTLARAEFQMLALSASRLAADLASVQDAYRTEVESETPSGRLRSARLAMCRDAIEQATNAETDLPGRRALIGFVRDTLESIRDDLGWVEEGSAVAPEPMLRGEGGSYEADQPRMLMGVQVRGPGADTMREIASYGFDLATVEMLDLRGILDSDRLDATLGPMFRQAHERGVGIVLRLDAQDLNAEDLPGLGFFLSFQKALVAASIVNEPAFFLNGEVVRTRFIAAMETRYGDRNKLNRAWRKRLFSFDEIDIWPDYDHPAYQHDWQVFQRNLGMETIASTVAQVRDGAPGVPLEVTFSNDVFESGESRRGTDRVAMAKLFDVLGLRSEHRVPSGVYAIDHPAPSIGYALLGALAPDKALFADARLTIASPEVTAAGVRDVVRTLAWEAAFEGVDAFSLDVVSPAATAAEATANSFVALGALAQAKAELDGLSEIVQVFQRAPAPVAILWSDSSKIFGDGEAHLNSVLRAYEGATFGGYKLRFITESDLISGTTDGIQVLIIPNTPSMRRDALQGLQGIVSSGVAVIRTTHPTPYDEHGFPLGESIEYGIHDILLRGDTMSTKYLHALDAVASDGRLESAPRAVNEFGYPLEGVKTQSVRHDDVVYVYITNFRRTPVTVHLSGETGGVDLIGGGRVEFPAAIAPLQPMLIRLDAPPAPIEPDSTLVD